MSDPVVEAAQKAWAKSEPESDLRVYCEESAREFAKMVRHLHYPVWYINKTWCCVTCYDENGKPHLWPCITGEKIYSTQELKEMFP